MLCESFGMVVLSKKHTSYFDKSEPKSNEFQPVCWVGTPKQRGVSS
jgi:hypothetical protein